MANAHAKPSHVFRVLRKKKGRAKACVLREFFLLSFNAVSLFCSALFRKTKVFCLKMLPLKHQINMCISQYQKDTRAAVRKGRARLHEQGALKAEVPSMRPSDKTVEWEVAKPRVWLVCHSCSRNSTPQNFMKLKFMKFFVVTLAASFPKIIDAWWNQCWKFNFPCNLRRATEKGKT